MAENREGYQIVEPNPEGLPRRWRPLVYRLDKLHPGQTYLFSITVPERADGKPIWTLLAQGKSENE
jgi:hypothetical protein